MKYILLSAYLLMLLLHVEYVHSQSSCPFSATDAVADTLDPQGYYPLQIGNAWEYVMYEGGLHLEWIWREEVTTDTLIGDTTFFGIEKTFYYRQPEDGSFRFSARSFRYRAVVDGRLHEWTPGWTEKTAPFFADFNSCDSLYAYLGQPVTITGSYDTSFVIPPRQVGLHDTIRVLAIKKFFLPLESYVYAYGIGLIQQGAEVGNLTTLAYARIDGEEYGVRLDLLFDVRSLSFEPSPRSSTVRFELYPNPASAATYLSFILGSPSRVTIKVVDVAGRVVTVPLKGSYLGDGKHQIALDASSVVSGVYVVSLQFDGKNAASAKLVVVR